MASLYNRATPSQRRILRAVEGAALNAGHHHPHWNITPIVARSIAKRAAGTLTAQWPDVLAANAKSPSDRERVSSLQDASHSTAAYCRAAARGRGASQSQRRSPLRVLRLQLGLMAGWARKAGHEQRAAALADALRALASVEKRLP